MGDAGIDVTAAHRWFAKAFNNAAWDLVEAGSRTPAETERMLQLAHAACLHWEQVGTATNRQRGLVLLVMAHVVAGQGARAVDLARQCLAVQESGQAELTPFDYAAGAACLAAAFRSDEQPAAASAWEHQSQILAGNLEVAEREVILRLLATGAPPPE